MVEQLQERALDYLATHQVMTLATIGEGGVWATAVFYATQQFDLFFLSASHTRHATDIAEQPHIAATIQEDYKDWPSIKGVQLEGDVRLLEGDERAAAIAIYQTKYPFLANASPRITAALSKVSWYRLRPTKLYFIDNSQGFGHRDEISLPN